MMEKRSMAARAKYLAGKNRKAGRGKPGGLPVRLMICSAVFVAAVLFKLLFPQTAMRLSSSVGSFLGRDADLQGAVAAVGRAVSGETPVGDALQDACVAVFSPSDEKEEAVQVLLPDPLELPVQKQEETPPAPQPVEEEPPAPEEKAPALQPVEELPPAGEMEEEPCPEDDTTEVQLSKVYTMPPMPENASLEQRNLGFAHQSPVVGKLTSPFGWREHPVEGGTKFHYGVDLSGCIGTPICAFADGEVYATGESSTLGKYVMLRHQGEYMTLYGHMSKVCVCSGKVSMGDKIGEVGDTGRVTGPHLHFELHDGSLYLNPVYYVDLG